MQNNEKEALLELWRDVIPTLQDPDDIDLINVDLVLRRKSEHSIPSPYNEKESH